MQRKTDWQEALSDLVLARLSLPFAWGTNDCAIFAADAVLAMRGDDPLADLRGQWNDTASAARVIAAQGGLAAAMDARGFVGVGAMFAQRGDIVLHKTQDGHHGLGVCVGDCIMAPAELGLVRKPVSEGIEAWRV